jgi:D-xylose transport system permease protein
VTAVDTRSRAGKPEEKRTFGTEITAYLDKLRGGDVGSMPAIAGLIVLVIFFSILQPDTFPSTRNIANLLPQSAPVIFIAMGLIFVLLLGEIDLAAGYTAGGRADRRCAGRRVEHPVVRGHPGLVPRHAGRAAADHR